MNIIADVSHNLMTSSTNSTRSNTVLSMPSYRLFSVTQTQCPPPTFKKFSVTLPSKLSVHPQPLKMLTRKFVIYDNGNENLLQSHYFDQKTRLQLAQALSCIKLYYYFINCAKVPSDHKLGMIVFEC